MTYTEFHPTAANPMTLARHAADGRACDGHGRMVEAWLVQVRYPRASAVLTDIAPDEDDYAAPV